MDKDTNAPGWGTPNVIVYFNDDATNLSEVIMRLREADLPAEWDVTIRRAPDKRGEY